MLKVSILGRRATRDVCLEFWTDQLLNASTRERHENPQHERAENRDGPIPKRPRGTAGSCGSGHTCQCCHCRVEITPAERAGLFKWGYCRTQRRPKSGLEPPVGRWIGPCRRGVCHHVAHWWHRRRHIFFARRWVGEMGAKSPLYRCDSRGTCDLARTRKRRHATRTASFPFRRGGGQRVGG
jgi:hypothetical protein